ncbi:pksN [Symbiodinium natans]|uniref:PksN protein n=1 Tax=Symbiodinium natans TaxID=878477 RepID=A0A812LI07_9DINO|nr:pksN [Symbiodinium natans]
MDVAIYLKSPTQDEMQLHIQHMSTLAKTRCLLCGEQVQDIQHWRRHMAQRHDSQKQLVQSLAQSETLLQAHVARPCCWCNVHFPKSAREHRRKCLPLLQLCLYHDLHVSGDHARATDGGSVGPQLTTGDDAYTTETSGTPQKYRKGMGKGAGKAPPKAKRDRDQEAEDELMMDLESLDEETVRTALKTLVKTALRHEHQLTILEADRSYVFFLDTTNHGIVSMLIQASATWNTKFEEGTVNTSLRATLWGVLLMEWKARLEKIESDTKVLQVAETAGWATRSPLQWIYNEWNPVQKKALPSSRDNLTHEDAKKAVNQLITNTAKDNTVHRFQSLRPLKPDLQAEVITMVLTLTVHQQAAAVYHDLDLLANNCAGKLIGLRLRRERVGKTALTKELERLQI